MICYKLLVPVLVILIAKKSSSLDILFDGEDGFNQIPGFEPTLATKDKYSADISVDPPVITPAFFDILTETHGLNATNIKGVWVINGETSTSMTTDILFTMTENPYNFENITLKYFSKLRDGSTDTATFELAIGTTPNITQNLNASVGSMWSNTITIPMPVGVVPTSEAPFSFKISMAFDVSNPTPPLPAAINAFLVLDSITFISRAPDFSLDDCREANRNTFTPCSDVKCKADGWYFYCYFNLNYGMWFLTPFQCPMNGTIRYEFCKTLQTCLAPGSCTLI